MTPLLQDLIEKYDGGKLTTDDIADRYINLYRHEPEAELPDDWEAKLFSAMNYVLTGYSNDTAITQDQVKEAAHEIHQKILKKSAAAIDNT